MTENWVTVEGDHINLNFVALIEREGGRVLVHLALPTPEIPGGVTYSSNTAPPVATGHVTKSYDEQVWDNANKPKAGGIHKPH
jgi:hypothetical protein